MDDNRRRFLIYWFQYRARQRHARHRRVLQLFLTEMYHYRRRFQDISGYFWSINYHQHWFECLWALRHSPIANEFYHAEFRMTVTTFEYIVQLTTPSMMRADTTWRHAIPVEKRVAVALWTLGTGNSYRTVSRIFGVSPASVNDVVIQFSTALTMVASHFIKFPTTEDDTAVMMDLFHK